MVTAETEVEVQLYCRWLIEHRPKGQGGPIQTLKNKCHALLALSVMSVPYICSPSLSVSIH